MIFLALFCICSAGIVPVMSDLNTEVDEYLQWYTQRLESYVKLNDIGYSWTSGYFWFKKNEALSCTKGGLNFKSIELARISNVTVESSDQGQKMKVSLSFLRNQDFTFDNCLLKVGQEKVKTGQITGTLTALGDALDLQFTYGRQSGYWCEVKTIELSIKKKNMNVFFRSELINDYGSYVLDNIEEAIGSSIVDNLNKLWKELVGSGPNVSDEYCEKSDSNSVAKVTHALRRKFKVGDW